VSCARQSVRHITASASASEHRLSRLARVGNDGGVTYPAESDAQTDLL
jgi:hypothetical protein